MSLLLLALTGLALGQDPWGTGASEAEPAPVVPSPWDPVPTSAPEPASPWASAVPAVESPWDAPPPSPWMLPVRPALELAPWWQVAEEAADPWGLAAGPAPEPDPWAATDASAPAPAPIEAPAPVDEPGWEQAGADEAGWGDASADEAGWGNADDAAGWGNADDAAGWGDADDAAGWGDADDAAGFGEAAPSAPAEEPRLPAWLRDFTVGGAVETRESLWLERPKQRLASARQSLDLELRYSHDWLRARVSTHAEVDFAYLPKREHWDEATTRTYGHQLLLREAWLSAAPGIVELAVGRQTVAWGDGLLLSPLDVVAPKDRREPGLAELEDLRLPVTMARLGAYPGNHRFELLWVPEFHPGFRSPPQGPYGYAEELVGQAPDLNPSDVYDAPGIFGDILDELYGEEFDAYVAELMAEKRYVWRETRPNFGPGTHQVYARWRVRGKGVDAGVYLANRLDDQGTIGFPDVDSFVEDTEIKLPIHHYRYSLVGHSGSATVDKLVFRWEQVAELHKAFNTANFETQPPQFYVRRGDLLTTMLGVNIGYIPDVSIDLEATRGLWLKEPVSATFIPPSTTTLATRLAWTGLREKLRLSATGIAFGGKAQYGALVRGDASYAVRDGLWATVGGIHYAPGTENGPLLGFDSHDQLFVQSRFSF